MWVAGVRELRGLGAGEARCLKVPQERGSPRGWSPSTCRILPLTDQDDLQAKLRNVQAQLNLGLLLTQSSYVTYSPPKKVVYVVDLYQRKLHTQVGQSEEASLQTNLDTKQLLENKEGVCVCIV